MVPATCTCIYIETCTKSTSEMRTPPLIRILEAVARVSGIEEFQCYGTGPPDSFPLTFLVHFCGIDHVRLRSKRDNLIVCFCACVCVCVHIFASGGEGVREAG